jgi:uncharacterized protein (DUF433 family)
VAENSIEKNMENLISYISINPEIRFGKPCIKDTRIAVTSIHGGLLKNFAHEHNIELPPLPNETTRKAIRQSKNWKKLKKYSSAKALMEDCVS